MKVLNCLLLLSVLTPAQLSMKAQISNQALQMDGFANGMECGSILPPSYTKEAWIKLSPNTGKSNPILSSEGFSGGHLVWAPAELGYRLAAGHNGRWDAVMDSEPLDASWNHISVTYDRDKGEMKLYKNGKLLSQESGIAPATDPSLQMGAAPFLSHFAGTIDEIRIWNYARQPEQIRQAMKETLTGEETGLIAYYRFNQTTPGQETPQIVLDDSPNHFHGRLRTSHETIDRIRWVPREETPEKNGPQTRDTYCLLGNSHANLPLYSSTDSGLSWGQEFVSCEPIILQQISLQLEQEHAGTASVIHLFEGNAEQLPGQMPLASSYYTTVGGRYLFRHVQLEANRTYTFLIEHAPATSQVFLVSEGDPYAGGNLVSFQIEGAPGYQVPSNGKLQRFANQDLGFVINPVPNQVMDRSRPRLPVHARSVETHHRVARIAGSRSHPSDPQKPGNIGTTNPRMIGQLHAANPRR